MRRFLWWLRVDPEDLQRAKRDDAKADERLREANQMSRWARTTLARDRDGFADALVHIFQGGAS